MNYYNVEIPIIRRNFDKTKSAKFKGKLYFICSENGIIFDWQLYFDYVEIDLFTTTSWFNKNTKNFITRKNLFSELDLGNQLKRPDKKSNKIIILNKIQKEVLNNFFNNRIKYNSTIKNIIAILKGNNPSGEFSNPKGAEIILNDKNSKFQNFVLLIDDLNIKFNDKDNFYNDLVNLSKKIEFNDFFKLNDQLKNFSIFLSKNKNNNLLQTYLVSIKEFYNKNNPIINKIENEISKRTSSYKLNIIKEYEKKKIAFGFIYNKSSNIFQNCHIYPKSWIKTEIINKIILGEKKDIYFDYLDWISDPNNFLPFVEYIHREFDKLNFSYNENGEIFFLNKKNDLKEKYKTYERIESKFLTKDRIFYLKKRNEMIKKIKKIS